ncbi:MAG: glycosyltransferase family 39 protein [Acidobacteriota bacterium]|nr:glycosyltransferase family 39 protein [Acidobacteriota bacterium]
MVDEPASVAAGVEWFDRGTYTIDPIHPPLPRILIGLPLYLFGERYPEFAADDPHGHNYNDVGNSVLYGDAHYLRNLTLARIGVLPFFLVAGILTFLWARDEFGTLAAVMAVALFTTLPPILAYSGLAYTDAPAASIQFATLYAFTKWLKDPGSLNTVLLGIALGLATLSNFTSLLFVPAAGLGILLCELFCDLHRKNTSLNLDRKVSRFVAIALIACFVVWGGYRFSFGHVRESMQLSLESMPSFQHFPRFVGNVARHAIVQDYLVPAPALARGLAIEWVQGKSVPPAYLLGETKSGGWWYFFPVAVAVKSPLAFLLLAGAGACGILWCFRREPWHTLAPLASAIAILLVTMPLRYDAGIRHILVIFPLLAIVAGKAAAKLLDIRQWAPATRLVLAGLLIWQAVSGFQARGDYLAYFNELGGTDPSKILLTGCDLDCGQDLFRLSDDLRARNIQHFSLAMWSSADVSKTDLPSFDVLQPFQPVSGWLAISARSRILGDVFHDTYPPGAFAWLAPYQPVEQIGRTIRLYHIPRI